jgi:hypothetical protein
VDEINCATRWQSWRRSEEAKSDQALNREAVVSQSPGLPGFGGYPGKRMEQVSNPDLSGLRWYPFTRGLLVSVRGATPSGLDRLSILSQSSRESPATLGSGIQPLRG